MWGEDGGEKMKTLTHLSLFTGIGGLDLAAEMAGIETVGQCEWADYQTKVLEKHWPGLPRWRDIRTLTKESFYERTGLRTVDIISGGFPCQPFSLASRYRRGKEDDRYLWPEMLRVIKELRPYWVVGENVPGIINLALDQVLSDLEAEGYETQCFIIPACGVDAPHKRERVCIMAYLDEERSRKHRTQEDASEDAREGHDHRRGTEGIPTGEWGENKPGTAGMANGVRTEVHRVNPDTDFLQEEVGSSEQILWGGVIQTEHRRIAGTHSAWENWPDEPGVDRVVDGLPHRMDRIGCLGNAVVPQQFYPFFAAIAKIERGE